MPQSTDRGRKRMRIGPNARRGGNIEDLRGSPALPRWIPNPRNRNAAAQGDYVFTGMPSERVARRASGAGRRDSRVTDYGQRLSANRPQSRGERALYNRLSLAARNVLGRR